MKIGDIQLFLAVTEEGSATQAGKRMGYTESGASHIIRNLEREIGLPLFTRTRKGLVLTPTGEHLLPYLRRIVTAHELFTQEASALRGVCQGHIVVGAYTSIAVQWLPAALRRFHHRWPNISVEIWEGHYSEFLTWLEQGSIDFALTGQGDEEAEGMDWIELKREPFLAVCPADSPFAGQDAFPLTQLEQTPCILPCVIDVDLFNSLQRLGIRPQQLITSREEFTILSLVGQGLGVSIRPELMLRGYRGDSVLLPVRPALERTLGILIPSLENASPAARSFLGCVRETVADLEGQQTPPCALEFASRREPDQPFQN